MWGGEEKLTKKYINVVVLYEMNNSNNINNDDKKRKKTMIKKHMLKLTLCTDLLKLWPPSPFLQQFRLVVVSDATNSVTYFLGMCKIDILFCLEFLEKKTDLIWTEFGLVQ